MLLASKTERRGQLWSEGAAPTVSAEAACGGNFLHLLCKLANRIRNCGLSKGPSGSLFQDQKSESEIKKHILPVSTTLEL